MIRSRSWLLALTLVACASACDDAASSETSPDAAVATDAAPPDGDGCDEAALLPSNYRPIPMRSTGAVATTLAGAVTTATIDATAGGTAAAPDNPYLYLDLIAGARVEVSDLEAATSIAWHVAIKRASVKLNGGDSGPGAVAAARVAAASLAEVTIAPTSFASDDWASADCALGHDPRRRAGDGDGRLVRLRPCDPPPDPEGRGVGRAARRRRAAAQAADRHLLRRRREPDARRDVPRRVGAAVNPAMVGAPVAGPPVLHARVERAHLAWCDGWEVLRTSLDDPRFDYFARRGMLHLQLWRPAGVGSSLSTSILTPSALTDGQVEVWVGGRGRARLSDYRTLAEVMRAERAGPLGPATVGALLRWHVAPYESAAVRLRRRWWCG
jgi:hypothetical protein